jgi:magnesium-transporting ATPase (P-type)
LSWGKITKLFHAGRNSGSLGISFYQDNRSRIAMEALEKLNEPLSTVLRNGEPIRITTAAIVIDDLVAEEEIQLMPMENCTAMISPLMNLTGEPYAVFKSEKTSQVHFLWYTSCIWLGCLPSNQLAQIQRLGNWKFITKHQRNTYSITNSNSKFVKVSEQLWVLLFSY